jgi:hypothetical protein
MTESTTAAGFFDVVADGECNVGHPDRRRYPGDECSGERHVHGEPDYEPASALSQTDPQRLSKNDPDGQSRDG